MEACDVMCPLASLLREKLKKNEENQRVYGSTQPTAALAILGTVMIVFFVCFIISLVGMVKAFNCGAAPTSLGLTGTGWGALILILVLLVPPVGSILGVMFAFGGNCITPELVM